MQTIQNQSGYISEANPLSVMQAGQSLDITQTYATSADAQGGKDISGSPDTGEKVRIDELIISSDTALALTLQSKTSNTAFAKIYIAENGTVLLSPRCGLKSPDADEAVEVIASGAGNLAITCVWHSEA